MRDFWEVLVRGFAAELWIQNFKMTHWTIDELCGAIGPLVVSATSRPREPFPTDKCIMWQKSIFQSISKRKNFLSFFSVCGSLSEFDTFPASVCNFNLCNLRVDGNAPNKLGLIIKHAILVNHRRFWEGLACRPHRKECCALFGVMLFTPLYTYFICKQKGLLRKHCKKMGGQLLNFIHACNCFCSILIIPSLCPRLACVSVHVNSTKPILVKHLLYFLLPSHTFPQFAFCGLKGA